MHHEIALGQLALICGGQDQVLAALAPVGSRAAHIHNEAEEGIVHRARSAARRNHHDRRAVPFKVEECPTRRRYRCCP